MCACTTICGRGHLAIVYFQRKVAYSTMAALLEDDDCGGEKGLSINQFDTKISCVSLCMLDNLCNSELCVAVYGFKPVY